MASEIETPITPSVSERPACDGCGATAPETNTDYTLISRSFGWRLTRRVLPNGSLTMEWRCASCWKKYKGDRVVVPSGGTSPGLGPAVRISFRPPPKSAPPPQKAAPPPLFRSLASRFSK